ncbi:MAG TPA: hypothetical protein ENJ01_09975 [Gammaproteobacteria bacterium]|nr:hypothetical protein [Gammaproteobacteria bacterium]
MRPAVSFSGGDDTVTAGEQLYVLCSGCHAPTWNRTGPRHCGLAGRRAGSLADFDYTPAMKNADIIWTRESLDEFLRAPLTMVPGTSMAFAGMPDARERDQLITFLLQLTDKHPLCR